MRFIGYAPLWKIIRLKENLNKKSAKDYFALIIATCFGIGYIPVIPATWGSLGGVGVYLLAQKAAEKLTLWATNQSVKSALLESLLNTITILLLIILFLIGMWAATRVEKLVKKKDPGLVVVDEVVGQLVTFLFVPARLGWWTVIIGFLAFRFFDILKPYPTRKFEDLPSGLGAMADDAMAGFYAAAFMSVICSLYLATV